ncbi:Hsp70 protein-domain-containing protein [Cadophora sp. MPI-SDFR-AT-0126]|nr:Hsp70 protein-domain-containing protein [Leotiomycetes sp. MPI-SDFR-AT-0126]
MRERRESSGIVVLAAGLILLLLVIFGQYVTSLFSRTGFDDGYPDRIDSGPVIGIHLGVDHSRVGFVSGYNFKPISDEQGRTAIPNYVAFSKTENYIGPPMFGLEAKDQMESNPKNTLYDFRRMMSRNSSDPEVQKAIKELQYSVLDVFNPLAIRVDTKNGYTVYMPEKFSAMILEKLKIIAEKHLNTTVTNVVIAIPYQFDEQQRNATIAAAKLAKLNVLKLVDEPSAIASAYRLDKTYCDGKGEVVDCTYIIYGDYGRRPHVTLLRSGVGTEVVLATIFDKSSRSSFWESLLGRVPLLKSESPTTESKAKDIMELVNQLLYVSSKVWKDIDGLIVITEDPEHTSSVQQILKAHHPNLKVIKPYDDFTPDQAIVCGASIITDNMSGPRIEPYFNDVVLLGLGIQMRNGSFLRILQRNYVTPLRKIAVVSVTVEDQKKISIPIYEGEHELASRNHHLGDIEIDVSRFTAEVQEKWMREVEKKGKVEIKLNFHFDTKEVLTVMVRMGGGNIQGFQGRVMGQQWRWRELEEIRKEAEEAREEEFRLPGEGNICWGRSH